VIGVSGFDDVPSRGTGSGGDFWPNRSAESVDYDCGGLMVPMDPYADSICGICLFPSAACICEKPNLNQCGGQPCGNKGTKA
jgi:hypothetical protein